MNTGYNKQGSSQPVLHVPVSKWAVFSFVTTSLLPAGIMGLYQVPHTVVIAVAIWSITIAYERYTLKQTQSFLLHAMGGVSKVVLHILRSSPAMGAIKPSDKPGLTE